MARSGVLLGYFQGETDADAAIGALKRGGFRRPALARKTSGGRVLTRTGFGPARLRRGAAAGLLRKHSRWLVPGESLVIIEARPEELARAIGILRTFGETPPALFVLHPPRKPAAGPAPKLRDILDADRLREHARELAAGHGWRG